MKYCAHVFCIFLCYLCVISVAISKSAKNDSVFIPTREWQIVNKGTPIPKGLHIRHNFQTGKTEAKLMDNEEKSAESTKEKHNAQSLIIHSDQSEKSDDEKLTMDIPIEELKMKLKKIKSDEGEPLHDRVTETKSKFKSYQELKKEFESLNMNITTEMELMKDYFAQFSANKDYLVLKNLDKNKVRKILNILDDLEYLIHQIDNAQVFLDMDGLSKIISPCLNSTSDEIKSEALRLLGATAQSNPKVQAKVLESDFIQKLLHLLLTTDSLELKSRCLFALSSLIRQFPIAQKVFFDHGGLEVFATILEGNQLQLQIRVMNLVNDLLIERRNIDEFTDEELRRQRTEAYEVTHFEEKLLMHNYCQCLNNFAKKVFQNIITGDFIEQADEIVHLVVESIITLNPVCGNEFLKSKKSLFPLIESALNTYKHRRKLTENEDENFDNELIFILEKFKLLLDSARDEL